MKVLRSLSFFSLLLGLACGGGGGGTSVARPTGQLTILLGADGQKDWSSISVGIDRIEASAGSGPWVTVAQPNATLIDLVKLQNGQEQEVTTRASLPVGTYSLRITWSPTAVAMAVGDSTLRILQMPTPSTTLGTLTIAPGAETRAFLMLDSTRAIQTYNDGITTSYLFLPHPQALDSARCGEIAGRVMVGTTPLAGQEVLAEVVDGQGLATIQRRVFTDADGAFHLRALPASQGSLTVQYFLVCMPRTSADAAFPAKGVGPVGLTSGGLTAGQDFLFTGNTSAVGSLQATFTPPSPKGISTVADLRQSIPFTATTQYLIVREAPASRTPASDARTFGQLPTGYYGVNGSRLSTPIATVTSQSQAAVAEGATTTLSLAFP